MIHQLLSRFTRIRRRLFQVISASDLERIIVSTVSREGIHPEILFVHSSLSRCGYLKSGPDGLLQILQQNCGTLCLPTHAYCYPTGNNETPEYDPKTTRSIVGTITNVFWKMPNVQRSVHPTHSLAASGPLADALCRDHVLCQTACGPDTPYAQLIERDAAVLMFGATMNTYTLFHCAEHVAGCSYLYEPEPYELKARDHDGKHHLVSFRRQDMALPRRFLAMREELHAAGLLTIVPFGQNEILFMPSSKAVHEYTLNKILENELHLVAEEARHQLGD